MLKTLLKIDNFILLKYNRTKLVAPKDLGFSKDLKENYLNCQEVLFYRSIDQIKHFYPQSKIHVLTNKPHHKIDNVIFHVFNEKWENHICKFKLFNLINEPAMYLDLDVVLNKKFPSSCDTNLPFTMYSITDEEDLQKYSNVNLPNNRNNKTWNTGVLWINKPSSYLFKEIINIHNHYFNDHQMILKKGYWPNNDEHAVSLFLDHHNLQPNVVKGINVLRHNINSSNLGSYQSVHYTGIKAKRTMKNEYAKFNVSSSHTDIQIKNFFAL